MITGAVKSRVDDIWQKMWEGGITNPIEVITQLTYLMFIRSLDEKEFEAERLEALGIPQEHVFPKVWRTPAGVELDGSELRWNVFKDYAPERMLDVVANAVFPFVKSLNDGTPFARSMRDAAFIIQNPRTLQKAVSGVDALMAEFDEHIGDLGDLYEYMLSKLFTAGKNGQFRTPKHIREMMVALAAPKPGELICDPAMGTAGFLISAAEYLRARFEPTMTDADWAAFAGQKGGPQQFSGADTDKTMVGIAAMNLMLHGITMPDISNASSLSKGNAAISKYDLILANPPFSGSVDGEDIDASLKGICDTKQTELLFVALFLRMLKRGGRCACIVPNGVLFRTNAKAYRQLRRELVENQRLEAVVYMPSGVFKPYSGVSTAVLVFTKTDAGGTDDVWLYNMAHDGYTLDDKRDADPAHDDIPDILARWADRAAEKGRARSEQSFVVSKQDIADNDYDLSFNKYTECAYEHVEYPPCEQILAELEGLNAQMEAGLAELRILLAGEADA